MTGQGNILVVPLTPAPGPPFTSASANNGASVDPNTGEIVLGNNVGSVLADLFSNRVINMHQFFLALNAAFTGAQSGDSLSLNPVFNTTGGPTAFKILLTDTAYDQATANLVDINIASGVGSQLLIPVFGAKCQFMVNGLQIKTVGGGPGGIGFNGTGIISNAMTFNPGFTFFNTGGIVGTGPDAIIISGGSGQQVGPTSGSVAVVNFAGDFGPQSGTAIGALVAITGAINQTGGANGITRGLYINPTLMSAADFRALEIELGSFIPQLGLATPGGAPFKYKAGGVAAQAIIENGAKNFDNTNETLGAGGVTYIMAKTLTATAVLDFPNTVTLSSSDLTIGLIGAAVGDVVLLGVPAGSVNANSCFTAFVGSADNITVRFNNYSALAIDPASGTFRVSIVKY
jgi:hypothetical protein